MTEKPRKNLLIIGSGGHGQVVEEAASLSGWRTVGYIDDTKQIGSIIRGVPVIGGLDLLSNREITSQHAFVVAIGDQFHRRRIATSLLESDGCLATVIHPNAVVSPSSSIGTGTVVMAGCVINLGSTIGRFCIINTGSTIDHDNRLDDGVQIAPGVNLAGHVVCERDSFLGIGAAVIPRVTIHEEAIIGAGAVVTRNIPARCTAVGSPARLIKRH